jgi:ABC-type polysaccharide/polyol phosphate export permease
MAITLIIIFLISGIFFALQGMKRQLEDYTYMDLNPYDFDSSQEYMDAVKNKKNEGDKTLWLSWAICVLMAFLIFIIWKF